MADSSRSPWDKGARLAELVAARRTLLVLDGLEPLQHSGTLRGELKDGALLALLRGLAARNPGLCVVTTREPVEDLAGFRASTAPEWTLEHLSTEAGVALLEKLGVEGPRGELGELVEEVRGHALTLNLLGRFLHEAFGGDVRQRDRIDFREVNETVQGGHAFRVMEAYERWFEAEGEAGARQLAILRLLGLFDRPASADCLAALRREPAIAGLTDALVSLRETGCASPRTAPTPPAPTSTRPSRSHNGVRCRSSSPTSPSIAPASSTIVRPSRRRGGWWMRMAMVGGWRRWWRSRRRRVGGLPERARDIAIGRRHW
jgi:hypothetical protein